MNRSQRRQLEVFLHFENKQMSLASLLIYNRRLYAFVLPVATATVVSLYMFNHHFSAAAFGIFYASILLRDIGYYFKSARVWPIVNQVLDWEKIHELASKD